MAQDFSPSTKEAEFNSPGLQSKLQNSQYNNNNQKKEKKRGGGERREKGKDRKISTNMEKNIVNEWVEVSEENCYTLN